MLPNQVVSTSVTSNVISCVGTFRVLPVSYFLLFANLKHAPYYEEKVYSSVMYQKSFPLTTSWCQLTSIFLCPLYSPSSIISIWYHTTAINLCGHYISNFKKIQKVNVVDIKNELIFRFFYKGKLVIGNDMSKPRVHYTSEKFNNSTE